MIPAEAAFELHSLGSERRRIGRRHREERLDGARHVVQHEPELVVGLGIAQRMARELAPVLVVVVPLRQVVSARQGRERALERQDVQAVARQLEVPDDLRPQQAHHVGEDREAKARKDFLAHRRAAHALAALEHQHLLSGAGEIGRANEAVVAAADDHRVVSHFLFLSGSKKGFLTTRAAARQRRCSTVISISSVVPGAAHSARRWASAMYFFRTGDQAPLVA